MGKQGSKKQRNEVGRAGVGSLDLYTKELVFVHNDISMRGGKLPLTVTHIFSKKLADTETIYGKSLDLGLGYGWRLNLHKFVFIYDSAVVGQEVNTACGTPKYVFCDADGEETVLYARTVDQAIVYGDATGNLIYDVTTRTLFDKQGGKLRFDGYGRMIEQETAEGEKLTVTYTGSSGCKISKIVDGRGRTANLSYDTDGLSYLTYTVDDEIRTVNFWYEACTVKTGDTTKSAVCMTKIVYSDETYSRYGYNQSDYFFVARDRIGQFLKYRYVASNAAVTIFLGTCVKTIEAQSGPVYFAVEGATEAATEENALDKLIDKIVVERVDASVNSAETTVRVSVRSIYGDRRVYLFNDEGKAYCSYVDKSSVWSSRPKVTGDAVYSEYKKVTYQQSGSAMQYEGTETFSATVEKGKKNLLTNGGFETGDTNGWTLINMTSSDGVVSTEGAEGNYSMKLVGGASTTKKILQEVSATALSGASSFIFSCMAKATANSTTSDSGFSIGAQIVYTDGTTETEETRSFYTAEKNWQFLAVGVRKSEANERKTISKIVVRAQYANGSGTAYFDDLRLIRGTFTQNTIAANVMETYTNVIEFENGSGRKKRTTLGADGRVVQTVVNDESGFKTVTYYTYDSLGHVTKTEEKVYSVASSGAETLLRTITNEATYNGQGNVTFVKIYYGGDESAYFLQNYEYDDDGLMLVKEYDERNRSNPIGYAYETSGNVKTVTLPNGQELNYEYTAAGKLQKVVAPEGTEYTQNVCSYTQGLITEIVEENTLYLNKNTYGVEYDGFGKPVKVVLNGVKIEYEYKRDGSYTNEDESEYNYTLVRYYNGETTPCEEKTIFTEKGNVYKRIVLKEGGVETNEILQVVSYDDKDRATSVDDSASGRVYTYEYDEFGRLKTAEYVSNTFEFADTEEWKSGKIVYAYDKRDFITSKAVTSDGSTRNYTYSYKSTDIDEKPSMTEWRNWESDASSWETVYNYDAYARLTSKQHYISSSSYAAKEEFTYLDIVNDDASKTLTSYVDTVRYTANGLSKTTSYTYDANGNITRIVDDGKVTSYEYDGLGRLTRENNEALNLTRVCSYNPNGNLTFVNEYAFTEATPDDLLTWKLCAYEENTRIRYLETTGDGGFSAALSNLSVSYDKCGNPCNYFGNVIEWKRGRLMTAFGENAYEYNGEGIRTKKTLATGATHVYDVEGAQIHVEKRGVMGAGKFTTKHTLWYFYDETGIAGVEYTEAGYQTTRYTFQKNIQGDVVRILDENFEVVATYVYDAWGNHKVYNYAGTDITAGDENADSIGRLNPFRYRGYYYDEETGLYYLQTRYYDPRIGRFLNMDTAEYLQPNRINGCNLYTYCGNNPVMYSDSTGENLKEWTEALTAFGWGFSRAGTYFKGVALSVKHVAGLAESINTIFSKISGALNVVAFGLNIADGLIAGRGLAHSISDATLGLLVDYYFIGTGMAIGGLIAGPIGVTFGGAVGGLIGTFVQNNYTFEIFMEESKDMFFDGLVMVVTDTFNFIKTGVDMAAAFIGDGAEYLFNLFISACRRVLE